MVGHNVYGLRGRWLKSEKEKGADCTLSKEICQKKFIWVVYESKRFSRVYKRKHRLLNSQFAIGERKDSLLCVRWLNVPKTRGNKDLLLHFTFSVLALIIIAPLCRTCILIQFTLAAADLRNGNILCTSCEVIIQSYFIIRINFLGP